METATATAGAMKIDGAAFLIISSPKIKVSTHHRICEQITCIFQNISSQIWM